MKLKSLLLGSAAALALSTGAQAADPISSFVSLDVCDAYGISGLTIASDDTCLKISGHVSYSFQWGDYATATPWLRTAADGLVNIDNRNGTNDWRSRVELLLRLEATTQTDAGAAKAVVVLRERQEALTVDNLRVNPGLYGGWGHALRAEEAWVSFGDTTVLMAGKKGTIAKLGNDDPFNYLGLVNSAAVEDGVLWSRGDMLRRGGHVIQIVSEVADGISVGAGLESIDGDSTLGTPQSRGTFVGFVEAKGAWGNAHATVVVGDILDNAGGNNPWGLHTGATFNFDNFKVRGALATDDTGYWNALLTGEAAFDLFTLGASAEFVNVGNVAVNGVGINTNQFGAGVSAGFQATDDIKVNLGFRYFDPNTAVANDEGWQAALQVVAALTDTITATGAVGVRTNGQFVAPNETVPYIDLSVAYKPGGGFETSAGFEANSLGAYKVKFDAKKSF